MLCADCLGSEILLETFREKNNVIQKPHLCLKRHLSGEARHFCLMHQTKAAALAVPAVGICAGGLH